MDKALTSLNWSLIQSFLAVAETGSLSAAARRLGASQPTVGRQIRQIETQLGLKLFIRQPRGLKLTETGQLLLDPAKTMRNAMSQIALTAAGQESGLTGTVRLTASAFVSRFILPDIIAVLRQSAPQISIELVASDRSQNLLFGEADIALRMYRPSGQDMIARHLGDMALGMFAASTYLDQKGRPNSTEQLLSDHDLIGYDQDQSILHGMRDLNLAAEPGWFSIRCDDNPVNWMLLRAGCGVGFVPLFAGLRQQGVEQVLPDTPLPALPVWLTAHQAMRHTPRIRKVWDMLAQGMQPFVS